MPGNYLQLNITVNWFFKTLFDKHRKILNEEPTTAYGITGYSPLLDVDGGFDIVHDIPIDPFHNINEGLVKLAMTRLFRKNATSKEILKRFNHKYLAMRTFRDSPRQTRSLKRLPDFKGNVT